MFTGLVEDVGRIVGIAPRGRGRLLTIETAIPTAEIQLGDSIAVDGVCLTAESLGSNGFTATVGGETMSRTTLGGVREGRRVHLERALRVGDRLGGHLVQGHVDGVGEIEDAARAGESWVVWVAAPRELGRYLAEKGSVCIDGVSLTVNELRADSFRVNLIPHTWDNTCFDRLRAGSRVNLEVDLLARYVERLLRGDREGLTFERLRALGYGRSS